MTTINEILESPVIPGFIEDKSYFLPMLAQKMNVSECQHLWSVGPILDVCSDITIELKGRCQYEYNYSSSIYVVSYLGVPALIAIWSGRSEYDTCSHYVVSEIACKNLFTYFMSLLIPKLPSAKSLNYEIELPELQDRRLKLGISWSDPLS